MEGGKYQWGCVWRDHVYQRAPGALCICVWLRARRRTESECVCVCVCVCGPSP